MYVEQVSNYEEWRIKRGLKCIYPKFYDDYVRSYRLLADAQDKFIEMLEKRKVSSRDQALKLVFLDEAKGDEEKMLEAYRAGNILRWILHLIFKE